MKRTHAIRLQRLTALLLAAVMTLIVALPSGALASEGVSNGTADLNNARSRLAAMTASLPAREPSPGAVIPVILTKSANTVKKIGKDILTDPTSTTTGMGLDTVSQYLGNRLRDADDVNKILNLVPKNGQSAKLIARLSAKADALRRILERSPVGTRQFNQAWDAFQRNRAKIKDLFTLSADGAKNAAQIEKLRKAGNIIGPLFNLINIYSDGKKLLEPDPGSTHQHASIEFIANALLGSSIAISTISLPFGKYPIVQAAGLLTGLIKDIVTSDSFVKWMNSMDNRYLRDADRAITALNHFMADPKRTAVTESLIIRWNKFFGNMPSDEDLAEAAAIHKAWEAYKKTNEYQEKLKRMQDGLGRKPGDGVGAYKPNLYLYPPSPLQVEVTFGVPGLLERTIPTYTGAWRVAAAPDGTLTTADGDRLRYLFYESLTWPSLYQTNEGWILNPETRRAQLWSIMKRYGFTDAETEDFVAYWTEKLEAGASYAMCPQLTDTVDKAMPVTIYPQPDNLFRLWFTFEKNGTPAGAPTVDPLIRDGFAVVEWGGVLLTDARTDSTR